MPQLTRIILSVCISLSFGKALAKSYIDPASGSTITTDIPVPRYLYHWTNLADLNAFAKLLAGPKEKIVFKNKSGTSFSQIWPQFMKGDGALFTWEDATAVAGGPYESYGDVLVRIEIDPDRVVAAAVEQQVKKLIQQYHPRFDGGLPDASLGAVNLIRNDYLNEWIIVDAGLIKAVTADPIVLRRDIENEIKKAKDPSSSYPRSHKRDLSQPFNADRSFSIDSLVPRNYLVRRLEGMLKLPRELIPDLFLSKDYPKRRISVQEQNRIIQRLREAEYKTTNLQSIIHTKDRLEINHANGFQYASEELALKAYRAFESILVEQSLPEDAFREEFDSTWEITEVLREPFGNVFKARGLVSVVEGKLQFHFVATYESTILFLKALSKNPKPSEAIELFEKAFGLQLPELRGLFQERTINHLVGKRLKNVWSDLKCGPFFSN